MRVVNLDDLSIDPDDLIEHAHRLTRRLERATASRRAVLAPVYELLIHYCLHKADAMQARLAGDCTDALNLERLCDGIYDLLPQKARW